MTYKELIYKWKDHPRVKETQGEGLTWDDWNALFGEALTEGVPPDEIKEDVEVVRKELSK